MNFMSFDVSSVEELTKCPLAKFITFSANDCGKSGIQWKHKRSDCELGSSTLKAKAAASKEDNPTWWEAMHGPFADEYWKATITEIETLEAMNAWQVVDCAEDMIVLHSTWAFKLKYFPN